ELPERFAALVLRAAGGAPGPVESRPMPLEVAARVPADQRVDDAARRQGDRRRLRLVLVRRDDRAGQAFRRRHTDVSEDLLHVAAEERVELRRVLGGEVVA